MFLLLLQHRTLLMLAAGTGQIQLMDLLIKKGVAVKSKDNAGRTALQVGAGHVLPAACCVLKVLCTGPALSGHANLVLLEAVQALVTA